MSKPYPAPGMAVKKSWKIKPSPLLFWVAVWGAAFAAALGVILADSDASSVVVELQVEKIGTKNFSIPVRSIRVDGMSEDMQLEYGPEQSVTIVFKGRDEVLGTLSEENFVASIDLTEFVDPGEYTVPVIIMEQPEGCEYTGEAFIDVTLNLKEELTAEPEGEPEVDAEPEV